MPAVPGGEGREFPQTPKLPNCDQHRWTVRMLGKFEVVSASGEVARFPSRTAVSLLAFLCLRPDREFANEELCDVFWPESSGDRQAQNLRRAIADLRKVLEREQPLGSVIATRKGRVSLVQRAFDTDAERFLELARQGERERNAAILTEAVLLYAGPLLAPFADGWAAAGRLELEERFGKSVAALCDLHIETGDSKAAIEIGRAAALAAPTSEEVHIALVRAFAASGRSVDALRQFEELERVLEETWGESPSPRAREALESAFRETRFARQNLPEQPTSFIGREREIGEVCGLLAETRLLTLTGSGGCGKTRLSLEAAKRLLDGFPDGVWFVELAALTDPELVPQTVATALGVPEQASVPIERTLTSFLMPKRLLLVVDNCEHLLLASARLVQEILRHCPGVRVLATSREGLAIGGETTYRVPSLSLPDAQVQTAESVAGFESVQLFVARARQATGAFRLTDDNAQAVASICARLDGIPLALELAAARLRSMSASEVCERLDDRFRLLTGGSRTAMPRQQTLGSLIAWSYDLLNEAEKALFRRLAVFAGGWTLDSAAQVCSDETLEEADVPNLLTALVDKSLVVAEESGGTTRYRMLETIHEYAWDRLTETGEHSTLPDRHLVHFLDLAEEAEPHLTKEDQKRWLDRLDTEHDNLRGALEWSLSAQHCVDTGLKLAGALWRYWYIRSHLKEGRSWLSKLLENPHREKTGVHALRALNSAGHLTHLAGDYQGAEKLCQEALQIGRRLNDRMGMAMSLNTLGHLAKARRDHATAWSLYEESLSHRREHGDQRGIAFTLNNLGLVALEKNEHSVARSLFEESLLMFIEVGDPGGHAAAKTNLGMVALKQGERAVARAHFEESLAYYRALGSSLDVASMQNNLADLAADQGDHISSQSLSAEALAISLQIGLGAIASTALEGLASARARLGDPRSAARLWGALDRCLAESGLAELEEARPGLEQRMVVAREALGAEAFDRAWKEGRTMTMEEAVALALAEA